MAWSLYAVVGGVQSNSFIATLNEADGLVAAMFPSEYGVWMEREEDHRKYCLILAAQMMSYLPWRGKKVYCNQGLCFPRSVQGNVRTIPDEVKRVQAYLAFDVIHRALAARTDVEEGAIQNERVTSVSLGGLLAVTFGGDPITAGTLLERLSRSPLFPGYLAVTKYISQVRWRVPRNVDDYTETCSTTTTTESTTSTSSSTTSTT